MVASAGRPSLLRALRHRNYRLFFAGQSRLAGRHLDHPDRHQLAGLPAHRLGAAARRRGVLRPDPDAVPGAGRRACSWTAGTGTGCSSSPRCCRCSSRSRWRCSRSPASSPSATVLVLQVFQGVINAFDMPARQAFVVTMIEDRADLPNAIALNSSMVNASRILGPSIGGVLIAAVGEGWCFLVDAISYLAVIASLLAMRLGRTARAARRTPGVLEELRARASATSPASRRSGRVLLLLALVSTDGHAVHRADAGRGRQAAARRPAHPRLADDGLGRRRAGGRRLPRRPRRRSLGLGRVIAVATALFGAALIGFGALARRSGCRC